MTGADEASYDEAASNAEQPAGVTDFRAIRSSLIDGTSTWQSARVASPTRLTVHDVEATLDNVRRDVDAARRRDLQVPAGMRGGFLTAAATLIDAAVRGMKENESQASIAARRVQYMFGQGAYELSFRAVESGRILFTANPCRSCGRHSRFARSRPGTHPVRRDVRTRRRPVRDTDRHRVAATLVAARVAPPRRIVLSRSGKRAPGIERRDPRI